MKPERRKNSLLKMPVVECSLHETIEVQFAHQSVLKEANWDIFGPKKSLCEIQTRKQGDVLGLLQNTDSQDLQG